jgi:hypothetical protein
MDNEEKKLASVVCNGYVFCETENPNQFLFYRKDDEVLGDVNRIAMAMHEKYICLQMIEGNITDVVMNNFSFERSDDGKCIRLTTYEIDNDFPPIHINTKNDRSSFSQKVKSLFKRKK